MIATLRANKATFVHFSPPNKLITNAALLQQQKVNFVRRQKSACRHESFLDASPTCLRTRSFDCARFRIEKYVQAISSAAKRATYSTECYMEHNYESDDESELEINEINPNYKDILERIDPTPMLQVNPSLSLPDDMNLGEIINFNVNHLNQQPEESTNKISTITRSVTLKSSHSQQPPNFPKPHLKFQRHIKHSQTQMKSVKYTLARSSLELSRPHTEPVTGKGLSSNKLQRHLPVIKEPAKPPKLFFSKNHGENEQNRRVSPPAFWNHTLSPTQKKNSAKFLSAPTKLTCRPIQDVSKGVSDILDLTNTQKTSFDYRENNAYLAKLQNVTEMSTKKVPGGSELPSEIFNFMFGRTSRAQNKSFNTKVKIQLYEPNYALSLAEEEKLNESHTNT